MTSNYDCKCDFELINAKRCALPARKIDNGRCRFHAKVKHDGTYSGGGPEGVKWYAAHIDIGEIVDFTNVSFSKHNFDTAQLPRGTCVLFSYSQLTDCSFTGLKIENGRFNGARFVNTSFRYCEFVGINCDFDDTVFDTLETAFEKCSFKLGSNGEIQPTTISFSHCTAHVTYMLFKDCNMYADLVQLNELQVIGREFPAPLEIRLTNSGHSSMDGQLCMDGIKTLNLDNLRLTGPFVLRQLSGGTKFSVILMLTNTDFELMSSAQFFDVEFENTWFKNSSIEKVKFYGCRWVWASGYKCLHEDVVNDGAIVKDYSELVRLYFQLKSNFEAHGDYSAAGDWYLRAMSNRRKALLSTERSTSTLKRLFNKYLAVISLYEFGSKYGESYRRPIAWLAAVLILFVPLYLLSGFTIGSTEIGYDMCWTCLTFPSVDDILRAVTYSLSTMAFWSGKHGFSSELSTVLSVLQSTLTAILVSLLLLAIRRRFKR